MNVNLLSLRGHCRPLLLAIGIALLTACGGGGGDDGGGGGNTTPNDPGNVSNNTAQTAARDSITQSINVNLDAAGSLITDAAALDTFAKAFGVDLSGLTGSNGLRLARVTRETDPTDTLEQNIADFINTLMILSDVTRIDDDTLLFNPDENALCNEELAGLVAAEVAECVDFFSHITMELTIIDDDSGMMDVDYDEFTLVTIDYSPNSIAYIVDLAQFYAAAQAITADSMPLAAKVKAVLRRPSRLIREPDEVGGKLETRMTILGDQHAELTLKALSTLVLVDRTEGIDFRLDPSTLFSMSLNGAANTASMGSALSELQFSFPVDDGLGNSLPAMLHWKRLEWNLGLSNNGNRLDASGTVGGDDAAYLTLGTQTSLNPEVLFHIRPFIFYVEGNQIVHTTAVDKFFGFRNDYDVLDNDLGFNLRYELSSSLSNGSIFVPHPGGIVEVTEGIFFANEVLGLASRNTTAAKGQCFGMATDGSGFHYTALSCPVVF